MQEWMKDVKDAGSCDVMQHIHPAPGNSLNLMHEGMIALIESEKPTATQSKAGDQGAAAADKLQGAGQSPEVRVVRGGHCGVRGDFRTGSVLGGRAAWRNRCGSSKQFG